MIIYSIRLVNIRSFIDETINFPKGNVLLSGDIGSGKTTILLGIEFAIFGIMKSSISAASLLRNGAATGFVELKFSVDDKQITIKRSLKKSSVGILQDTGIIIINGIAFEGSPQELKSRVLELLGYPESLLTKSKSFVFRYTVFTAQEEMKKILFESREERLDILRRLFDLDKYKRVKENTANYSRSIKSKIDFIEGTLASLPTKKKEFEAVSKSINDLAEDLKQLEANLSISEIELKVAEKALRHIELEVEDGIKLDKELEVKKAEVNSQTRQLEKSQTEISKLKSEIDVTLAALDGFDASKEDEIRQKMAAKKLELSAFQEKFNQIISKRAENLAKKTRSEDILSKLSSLDSQCPLCLQQIRHEHKEDVKIRERQIILACNANLETLSQFEIKFKERQAALEKELEKYIFDERQFGLKKAKFEVLSEKKSRKELLEIEASQVRKSLESAASTLANLSQKSLLFAAKKNELNLQKKQFEEKKETKNMILQAAIRKKAQVETLNKFKETLEVEIKNLGLEEAKLHALKARRSWLEDDFISLVDFIEKSVLFRVHTEFSGFFQEWFNILLEDEAVSVRLDDSFSVLVEQNGYETTLDNLSGGEKTSVALAYRLALNKVINDFMTSIKTRDLIILDEPTDGFSTEQLDRVREVLRQANAAQVIIVSHEAKMEGFVDNIIRVQKHNHVSKIS